MIACSMASSRRLKGADLSFIRQMDFIGLGEKELLQIVAISAAVHDKKFLFSPDRR